jgi:hypothetical protein
MLRVPSDDGQNSAKMILRRINKVKSCLTGNVFDRPAAAVQFKQIRQRVAVRWH